MSQSEFFFRKPNEERFDRFAQVVSEIHQLASQDAQVLLNEALERAKIKSSGE